MVSDWMNYLKSFKDLLKKEAFLISKLVDLEEEKYEALKQVEMKDLMRLNTLEEEILHSMDGVEEKRKNVLSILSETFHFDINLSLSKVLNFIPDDKFYDLKQELETLRQEIKAATGKLQMAVRENSEMLHSNMEIINLTLNFANRNFQRETYDYRMKKTMAENRYLVNQIV
jgi:hypothetical protein